MKLSTALISLACAATLAACSPEREEEASATSGEVNIYSSRHYDADLELYQAFTDETGIKVNLIEADADALIARIESEGEYSPADVLMTVDAGRLWRAESAGVFSPVQSEVLNERVPEAFRHPQNLWFGFASRARVIIHNDTVEPLETYADLASDEYRGELCMRSSSNIYNISLLASIIANESADAAKTWAKGVVANFKRRPQGNDTSNIEAVASGECGVSIVNSYYIARFISSDDPVMRDVAQNISVVFPNQEGRGTHVNISGAGIPENAPNRENAIRFLEFMTEQAAQTILSRGNHEYPIRGDLPEDAAILELGRFKADSLDVSLLGVHQSEAVMIYDRVGWR